MLLRSGNSTIAIQASLEFTQYTTAAAAAVATAATTAAAAIGARQASL
jgi:hypothetical protein